MRSVVVTALLLLLVLGCESDPDRPVESATRSAPSEGDVASPTVEVPPSAPTTDEETVRLASPSDNDVFSGNPLAVSGTARTFENNVVLELLDDQGELILQTSTTARGEMGQFNPWTAELWVTRWPGETLTIRAVEYSAKDGSERSVASATLRNGADPIDVELYFLPTPPGSDCTVVAATKRKVPKTRAMARLITEMLIAGPTPQETQRGLTSQMIPGARVESISITDGVLTVDFSAELRNVGGSCRALAIRSSVEKTLQQLPTVDRVRITAAGSESLALQP